MSRAVCVCAGIYTSVPPHVVLIATGSRERPRPRTSPHPRPPAERTFASPRRAHCTVPLCFCRGLVHRPARPRPDFTQRVEGRGSPGHPSETSSEAKVFPEARTGRTNRTRSVEHSVRAYPGIRNRVRPADFVQDPGTDRQCTLHIACTAEQSAHPDRCRI